MRKVRADRLLVLCAALASSIHAQVPFYTDDTGVTEPGTLHFEVSDEIDALQSMQYPDFRQNTANVKANVGLPRGFELDVDAPYITIDRRSGMRGSRGVGDTNLGVKWSTRHASGNALEPGFAVSFYTEFPTGNSQQELGSGVTDYWLNLIAQLPVSDKTRFNVNLGLLFAGNTSTGVVGIETKRGHVYTGGVSLLHDFNPRLTVGAEVYGGIADSSGLDRDQLQAMVGAECAIADRVSVYVGVVAGTFTASPRLGGQIGFTVDFPHLFNPAGSVPMARSARAPGASRHDFHLETSGDPDGL